jgi:hypothetical protein
MPRLHVRSREWGRSLLRPRAGYGDSLEVAILYEVPTMREMVFFVLGYIVGIDFRLGTPRETCGRIHERIYTRPQTMVLVAIEMPRCEYPEAS